VVTVDPENLPEIETRAARTGVSLRRLGTTAGNQLTLPGTNPILISTLQARHESWLPEFMGNPA
jgi:phosphoribosylformylglycinamidine synthase